jgi:hypothetical protein
MNIDYELLAIKTLLQNIEKTQAYDGYSTEHQIKFFENKNKYNPIIEFQKLNEKLIQKYLKEEYKKDFYNKKESWMTPNGKNFLETLEKEYSETALDIQIANYLIQEYFRIRK